jgi:uncharacterized protein (DUF2236 family)
MWRVNREAVLLGAGPTALLLQIAHPVVAEAVAAHSRFEDDPFGRLRRTLRTTLDIIFGDGLTATRAVRRLNGVHAAIQGEVAVPAMSEPPGRQHYRALEPELLLWVQATLVVSSVRAYRRWVGRLDTDAVEGLWQEARTVGHLLGIPASVSPSSYAQLEAWFEQQLRSGGPIRVTATARTLARSIVRPPIPWLPGALTQLATIPGLALLPPRIRSEYGIAWPRTRALASNGLDLGIRAWTAMMPMDWRAMPQARAAERRTRGAAARADSRKPSG